jgi:hypothetical protein
MWLGGKKVFEIFFSGKARISEQISQPNRAHENEHFIVSRVKTQRLTQRFFVFGLSVEDNSSHQRAIF